MSPSRPGAIHQDNPKGEMVSTENPTDGTEGVRTYTGSATLTVDEICRLLRLAPTAVPVLAENGDITLSLPPAQPGYCPHLDDVRIVCMRRSLTSDTALLARLRAQHPPEKIGAHLWRVTALGGILRVLGR